MRTLRSPHSLLVGIAVGVFLGLCINLLDNNNIRIYVDFAEEEAPKVTFYTKLPPHLLLRPPAHHQNGAQLVPFSSHPSPIIWFRCAIVILESDDGSGKHQQQVAEKSLAAVRDTWARECNETLFFTDSAKLQQRYDDAALPPSMRIFLLQPTNSKQSNAELGSLDWRLMRNLVNFLSKSDQKGGRQREGQKIWTMITNGRSYLHMENLHRLLHQVDQNAAIIVGRQVPIQRRGFWHSVLSAPFASVSNSNCPVTLSSGESPLIFSPRSLRLLAAHCSVVPFRWSFALFDGPRHAGHVIGGCAARLGIALWDPVDQEARPLIVDTNLKSLFSRFAKNATISESTVDNDQHHQSQQHLSASAGESSPQLATCCSDRSIAFASLNHKELRLIDFGVHRLKVFGTRRSR